MTARSILRSLVVFVAFTVCAAASSVGINRWIDGEAPHIPLDVIRSFRERLTPLARRPVLTRDIRIAFLGDSTVVMYPPGKKVPDRLQSELGGLLFERRHDPTRVYNLGMPAMGPFEYYFLSSPLVEAAPDHLVLCINLAAFSERWRRAFARPELAGWIPEERVVEAARLPLHWIGLSLDDLLLYTGLVNLGAAQPWWAVRKEHARIQRSWDDFARRIERARGAAPPPDRRPVVQRFEAARLRELYGVALAGAPRDHPVIRVLAAAIRAYERAGIDVLVYVIPTNVEYLTEVGVFDARGLEETLMHLRQAVEREGGRFLDLHALLPDAGFRDGAGHFAHEEPLDGPVLLARELAPVLAEAIAGDGD